MAQYKASDVSACLQKSVIQSFSKRAWGILSISLQKNIADSILHECGADLSEAFGDDQGPPIDLFSDMHR